MNTETPEQTDNEIPKEPLTAQQILDSDDLHWLFKTNVELTEDISATHREIREAQTESEKSDAQGELSVLYALQEITKHKIAEAKDTNNRLNYNFRIAAKYMLKKETYKALMEQSNNTVRSMKANKDVLKTNKLE